MNILCNEREGDVHFVADSLEHAVPDRLAQHGIWAARHYAQDHWNLDIFGEYDLRVILHCQWMYGCLCRHTQAEECKGG